MGGVSDHARIYTQLHALVPGNKKPFKFFNRLTSHTSFLQVTSQTWTTTANLFHSRQALLLFHTKLKNFKWTLRNLNKDVFGNLPARVSAAYEILCQCQNVALVNPNADTFYAVTDVWNNWHHLSGIEESSILLSEIEDTMAQSR